MGQIRQLLEKERRKFVEEDRKKKAELRALAEKTNATIASPEFCRELVKVMVRAPRGKVFHSLVENGEHAFTFQELFVKAIEVKEVISGNSKMLEVFDILCSNNDFVGTENIYHERKYSNTKYKGEFYRKGREGYNHQKMYLSPLYLKKVAEPYFVEEGMRIALADASMPEVHYEFISDIILKIKLIEDN